MAVPTLVKYTFNIEVNVGAYLRSQGNAIDIL